MNRKRLERTSLAACLLAASLLTSSPLAGCRSAAAPGVGGTPPAAPATTPEAPAPPPATAPVPEPAATATAAPEPAKEYKNTIKWATASEVENFGYDVYRGESEEGPFARITASPVPGAGTSDETHRYEYVDRDIDPHKDYWYYVESIALSGAREKFTPTSKAPAKLPKE